MAWKIPPNIFHGVENGKAGEVTGKERKNEFWCDGCPA